MNNKTFISPLLPASRTVVEVQYRSDLGRDVETAFGTIMDNQATALNAIWQPYLGSYRVEIIPSIAQLTDYFCTAIEVAPSSGGSQSITQAITGTNFIGGGIGNAIGVHATTLSPQGGTFLVSSAGNYRLVIGGLGASVTRTLTGGSNVGLTAVSSGSNCSSGCTTTPQGTITLNLSVSVSGTGAGNTITVGAPTGGAPPPRPPSGVRIIP
jgi:hypothetical protein